MKEEDLKKLREEDRKLRRLRFEIQTQLNDTVEAFMYAVENKGLEFDKDTEDYIVYLFLNERTIKICVEDIKTGKRNPMELLQLARDLAKRAVKITSENKENIVLESHVKKAIESIPESKIWPFEIKTK
jgi:hypothetical protein